MDESTGYGLGLWIVAALVVAAAAAATAFSPLQFDPKALANLGVVLAPLVAVAAFIERAVEVILTPLRGDTADRMQAEVTAAAAAGQDAAALKKQLHDFKLGTRRYAFLLAVSLGVIASLLGVRGLENLVSANTPLSAPAKGFDVVLTGLLLGGGADGIHKPVKAFTDYMNMISKKSQAAAP